MKILFFGQNPKLPSGMAKVGDNLAKELSKYHDVFYQAQTGAEYAEDYHGYTLNGNQSGGGGDIGMQKLGQAIAQQNPDALVTNLNWHQLFQLPQVTNQFRSKDDSMPIFLHTAVESEEPVPGMYQYMIENHMNDVYLVPYTESHYEMWQGTDMEKFVPDFVPHGVDHSIYQETPPQMTRDFYRQMIGFDPEDHTTFLFVGENWRRKRADLMLKAFKQFKEEENADDAKIVLHTSAGPSHGDGLFYTGWEIASGPQNPQPNPLLDTIGLELGEDVHLTKQGPTDKLPEEQMPYLYGGADAFVLPTMSEGFGLPLMEAGACGTPSLVTDTGVTRELCRDSALYFDKSQENYLRKGETMYEPSIESMKEKFKEFYNMSDSERRRLGQKAKQRAQSYTWKNAARKFDDLFEQHMNGDLPTKRANEASKIGSDIDIDMEELMNE